MKKVLVLSNMYPGNHSPTFGIFVENQVKALRKEGLHVDVVAVTDSRMGQKFAIKKYFQWFLKGLFNIITKGWTYDVIHVHYVFPTGLLGLLYKKIFRKRLIVTAHGGDIERMANLSGRISRMTQHILNRADHVIAVGDDLKTQIVTKFAIPESKIAVLNMGVNREVFKPYPKEEARKELGLSLNQKHLLFVGNIIKAKGVQELIEGFELLDSSCHCDLHIIGHPKDPDFMAALQSYKQEHGLDHIHFYQAKPQEEIARWMSAADVFILPSYMEGFGLVALEAMSCHTPVIGTKVGGLEVLLEEDCGILIEAKSSVAIKDAINEVLSNEQRAHTLITNGETKAKQNDQHVLMAKLIDIYFHKR